MWLYSKIDVKINGQKKKSAVRLGRDLQSLAQRQSHGQGPLLTDQLGGMWGQPTARQRGEGSATL